MNHKEKLPRLRLLKGRTLVFTTKRNGVAYINSSGIVIPPDGWFYFNVKDQRIYLINPENSTDKEHEQVASLNVQILERREEYQQKVKLFDANNHDRSYLAFNSKTKSSSKPTDILHATQKYCLAIRSASRMKHHRQLKYQLIDKKYKGSIGMRSLDLNRLKTHLENNGLSSSTVHVLISLVISSLKYFDIPYDKAFRLGRLTYQKEVFAFHELDKIQTLFDHFKRLDEELYNHCFLLFYTCSRLSELEDILKAWKPGSQYISFINKKTKKTKQMKVSDNLAKVLANTKLLSRNEFRWKLTKALVHEDFPFKDEYTPEGILISKSITSHVFRKSFATIKMEQGLDIVTISQKLLLHGSLESTMRYLKPKSSLDIWDM